MHLFFLLHHMTTNITTHIIRASSQGFLFVVWLIHCPIDHVCSNILSTRIMIPCVTNKIHGGEFSLREKSVFMTNTFYLNRKVFPLLRSTSMSCDTHLHAKFDGSHLINTLVVSVAIRWPDCMLSVYNCNHNIINSPQSGVPLCFHFVSAASATAAASAAAKTFASHVKPNW